MLTKQIKLLYLGEELEMSGKDKCKFFKRLRESIAKKHNIPGYEYKECGFTGKCSGTCPACDRELKELTERVAKLEQQLEKKIQVTNPEKPNWEKPVNDFPLSGQILGRPPYGFNSNIPDKLVMGKIMNSEDHSDRVVDTGLEGDIADPWFDEEDTSEYEFNRKD